MSLPIIFAGTENALPAVGTAQNVIYFVKNTKKIFITNGDGNPLLQLTDPAGLLASLINVANGIAGLDESGRIDADQLPSFVDDVIEGYLDIGDTEGNGYEAFYEEATFDTIIAGEAGKIYSDLTPGENKTYRWGGTAFVNVSNPHTHTNKANLDLIDQNLAKTDFDPGFPFPQFATFSGLGIGTNANKVLTASLLNIIFHKSVLFQQNISVNGTINNLTIDGNLLRDYITINSSPYREDGDMEAVEIADGYIQLYNEPRLMRCNLTQDSVLDIRPQRAGSISRIRIKRNGFQLRLDWAFPTIVAGKVDDPTVPRPIIEAENVFIVAIKDWDGSESSGDPLNMIKLWIYDMDNPTNPFGLSASDINAALSSEFNSLSADFANINTAPEANKNSRLTITQGTGSPYNIDCGSNMRHMYCSMTHDGILVASPDTVGAPMMIDIKRNGYAIQFGSGAETPVAGTVTNDLIRVFIEKIGATSFQYQVLNLNE